MRNQSNLSLSQSVASMAAALLVSLFVLGATTTTGPTAATHATAPIA
ncbi:MULTISPECIES: hypothetical protein [unclassified Sphingomonas]|nr:MULTISPECIES: hypothetical protein [unclassified Sphingomonas]